MQIINIEILRTLCNQHKNYISKLTTKIQYDIKNRSLPGSPKPKYYVPWEAHKYREYQTIESVTKQFFINYDELIQLGETINSEYKITQSFLSNKISLTYPSTENLDIINIINVDDKIQWISKLVDMNRDAILLILKSVITHKPTPCPSDPCNIQPYINFTHIYNPPSFNFGQVIWLEGQQKPVSKYRYMPNFELKTGLRKIVDKLNTLNSVDNPMGKYDPQVREATYFHTFLLRGLNQTRSVNVARMCVVNLLLFHVTPPSQFTLHHCEQEQNPSMHYIQQLLSPYISWPFLDSTTEMYYPNDQPMSTQLPLLMYSILTKTLAYTYGVITVGYFNLCISNF